MTVGAWLDSVFHEVADMLDHQRVGLEDIISALDLPRGDLNALYRVMLTQSPVDEGAFRFDGAPMQFRTIPTGSVKMDMILELAKSEKQYLLRFSYASSIFSEETIAFYGRCIEQILKEFVRDENGSIGSLKILSPRDQEKYIDEPIYRTTPFVNRPIHLMLKNKVLQSPDEIAVIWHGESVTYSTLEKRACAIARFIEENGVQPGSCIGLCLNRTPDMIAAMYGVLKAGCAYMFMLKTFPEARLRYMLEISNAALVLYDEIPQELLNDPSLCPAFPIPEGEAEDYADRPVTEDHLVNAFPTPLVLPTSMAYITALQKNNGML